MLRLNIPKAPLLAAALTVICVFVVTCCSGNANAASGINPELSFEGKIVGSTGQNIADGTYNMEFKIYSGGTAAGGGTLVWTEDWLVSASNGVSFTSGTFQANLGSICSFSGGSCGGNTNTGVDWSTNPLYVSINVGGTTSCTPSGNFQLNCGGGGEMQPYILLTSSPYAMNAGELNGLAASAFGQLGVNQTWTGTNTIQTTSSAALQVINASNAAILTANTSSGTVSLGQTGASGLNGTLLFNSATASNYAVTLNTSSSLTSSYSLTLPTSAPGTGQCLQSDATTASQLVFGTCGSPPTMQSAYNGGSTINTTASGTIAISAGAVPTADMVNISNAGQGITSNNVNDLGINFIGGGAGSGSESAGMRIDYTPGGTSGSVWDGLHIVNSTGSGTGVTSYGIKLDGNTGGAGTDEGVFVGTGWDIGMDIQSGGLQLASQSTPAIPAANELRVYAQSVAGRMLLKVEGPSGLSYALQPSLFANKIGWWTAQGNGTTVSVVNLNNTTTGTATSRTVATTSFFTQLRRIGYVSAATAGSGAGTRNNAAQFWLGNTANEGGFYYVARFGLSQIQSSMISFVGLSATAGALSATTNPSSDLNMLGFACDSTDSQFTFMHNSSSGTATKETLSGSFPCNTANTDVYDARIFAAPDASEVCYEIQRLNATDDASGCVTTKLPSSTTLLSPQIFASNNTTAAAVGVDVISQYIETDN